MPTLNSLKDLKITFKPHPVTDDLQVVKDDAAVKQSIVNLLLTVPGERLFNNQIGSSLSRLLFEPLDFAVAAMIKSEITSCIRKYEPRVEIKDVNVDVDYDQNGFSVELFFKILGRDDSTPRQINFLLQRTQ